ncbi:MAG: phosphomannomutase/phosphoglucomutase [Planctomycetota bacterium]
MGIFKAYDIRGLYPSELDGAMAKRIGNAFARFLGARRIVVGQDMRTHSPALADAVSEGARDAGCDVIRLGLASTPMAYFAIATLECDGGLNVTASHNPGEYNGMKLCRDGARPVSMATGIDRIQAMCVEPYPAPAARRGREERAGLLEPYADHVASFADLPRPISVAIDAGNGMAGYTLPRILPRLPEMRAHTLFLDLDGTFPNHEANPLKEENLRDVQRLVRETGAELGVAFDGDADRCCFVDEAGTPVGADLMTALLAPRFLRGHAGAGILYDLRSSWVVKEEIERAGGVPIRERVGHSFIKATMRKTGAVFGGELSGHFYFAANFMTDSGEIAMASALSMLAAPENAGRTLGELVAGLRRYHATGEINFRVADKEAAIAALRERFADGRQDDLDGITVEYGRLGDREWWWCNVRASNTEPLLRLNLEASSPALRDRRREEIVALLGDPV